MTEERTLTWETLVAMRAEAALFAATGRAVTLHASALLVLIDEVLSARERAYPVVAQAGQVQP